MVSKLRERNNLKRSIQKTANSIAIDVLQLANAVNRNSVKGRGINVRQLIKSINKLGDDLAVLRRGQKRRR